MPPLTIAGREFASRLFLGTGKFPSNEAMRDALGHSGTQMVTVALRRADLSGTRDPYANILEFIDPERYLILPNTSGAMNAAEAAVSVSPVPPAFSDSTKNGGPSSRWKRSTSAARAATGVPPCSTSPSRPNTGARHRARGSASCRNCVNTSAFSPREAISSQSVTRRANLALSATA
jgi:hypothetical protein